MKSAVLMISGGGQGIINSMFEDKIRIILKEADKMAKANELTPKQEMHLRLLTEETLCMLPEILQYGSGTFWIENYYHKFEIHVRVKPTDVVKAERRGGNNTSLEKKGILRRICNAFDNIVNETQKQEQSKTKRAMMNWSLMIYIENLKRSGKSRHLDEWDELEKSIIANLADNVTISTVDDDIEIVVEKMLDQ